MNGAAIEAGIDTDGESRARYRLIAFDFDGTLADTFDWLAGIFNEVADRYRFRRVEPHEAEALRHMDGRSLMRHLGVPAWKLPLISRHVTSRAARDIASVRLFPGVPDMIAALRRSGFRLAVVSSNSEANVRVALGPLAADFDHYACSAALFGKARRLRAVARKAGVPIDAMLKVGDEIRDLEAARQAGCAFGAVSWGYTRIGAIAPRGPDLIFEDLTAIAAQLCRDQLPRPNVPGRIEPPPPAPNGSYFVSPRNS